MTILERMQNGKKISIGMVHTLPLPGTYLHSAPFEDIVARAVQDAVTLEQAGFDAIIVENTNDGPFEQDGMTTTQIAAMTRICHSVRAAVGIEVGIDACGDSVAGLDIGNLTGVTFLRVPYFVDTRMSAGGIIYPNGGRAVMHRKRLGAEHIKIFADVQVKHTFSLSEIPIEESALWAVDTGADALIVTGLSTGIETPIESLRRVKAVVKLPVVAGSGVNASNVRAQYQVCDGAIIGTATKQGRNLLHPVDAALARAFINTAKQQNNA